MIILSSQGKDNLLKGIKKSPFFSIVTDKETDVANKNLVTFIKKEKQELHLSTQWNSYRLLRG